MKHQSYSLTLPLLIAAALLLTGCRSSRHAVKDSSPVTASEAATDAVSRVNGNRVSVSGVKAKMNLQAKSGNSKVSSGGSIRMQRDHIIQISVMFMGFVEAGRIELTPDYIFIQNRISHEYCKTRWRDIQVLRHAGIDFYSFQALFWEELFVPGRRQMPQAADFDVLDLGTTQKLTPTAAAADSSSVAVSFIIGTVGGLIRHTHLQPVSDDNLTFDWSYTRWAALDEGDFPEEMALTVQSGRKTFEATIGLSHLEADDSTTLLELTEPSKRYKQVEIGNIINRLLSNGR